MGGCARFGLPDATPHQASATLDEVGFTAEATAYGRPAVELLARQVSEPKAGDPLAPVTVRGRTAVIAASVDLLAASSSRAADVVHDTRTVPARQHGLLVRPHRW